MTDKELLAENLWGVDPATPIYRICQTAYLVKDINSACLTMPRVVGWEDTHEGAFFRRSVPTAQGEMVGLSNLAKDWFGLCWSTQPESDAMWRIYNAKGNSVRITTTAGALLRSLFQSRVSKCPVFAEWARLSLFVGRVSYHDRSSFEELMSTPVQQFLSSNAKGMASTFLQKRDPFDHEREVRLLYQSHSNGDYLRSGLVDSEMFLPGMADYDLGGQIERLNQLIQLPFDWTVVTDVMIGPRVESETALSTESSLLAAAPWMSVTRSELYGRPNYPGRF